MLMNPGFPERYLRKFHEKTADSHRQNIILFVAVAKSIRRNWK